jgi:hypothetical protein
VYALQRFQAIVYMRYGQSRADCYSLSSSGPLPSGAFEGGTAPSPQTLATAADEVECRTWTCCAKQKWTQHRILILILHPEGPPSKLEYLQFLCPIKIGYILLCISRGQEGSTYFLWDLVKVLFSVLFQRFTYRYQMNPQELQFYFRFFLPPQCSSHLLTLPARYDACGLWLIVMGKE